MFKMTFSPKIQKYECQIGANIRIGSVRLGVVGRGAGQNGMNELLI